MIYYLPASPYISIYKDIIFDLFFGYLLFVILIFGYCNKKFFVSLKFYDLFKDYTIWKENNTCFLYVTYLIYKTYKLTPNLECLIQEKKWLVMGKLLCGKWEFKKKVLKDFVNII